MSKHKLLLTSLAIAGLVLIPVSPVDGASSAGSGRGASSWCGTWDWGIEVSLAKHELNQRR